LIGRIVPLKQPESFCYFFTWFRVQISQIRESGSLLAMMVSDVDSFCNLDDGESKIKAEAVWIVMFTSVPLCVACD
jgi:hypothetical protein